MTPNEFTPPNDGRVGGSPSLETLYRSTTQPVPLERTTLDAATRRGPNTTPSTAPFPEAHNDPPRLRQSDESRPHPLPQQFNLPRAATGVTTAPRQQNTVNVLCDHRGEPTHQPASYTRIFRQGAYVQQDYPEGKMPGYRRLAPLAHTHDSASSGDSTQTTYEHSHHPYTLPPIKTQFERRQNSSTPTGYDRWRWQRQYHRGRIHDNTREHNCDKNCDTYESHIMENRRLEDDPEGDRRRLVHGTSHMGPPLKPLDPPPTESIAQKQQLYVLRRQEAEEYPVVDTYQ